MEPREHHWVLEFLARDIFDGAATNQAFPNGSVNAARRSPSEGRSAGSSIEDAPASDAARIANTELILWLEREYGYDRWDAYQLLTQAGGLYVGNMVDTTYSLVASVAKEHLGRPR